MAIVAVLKCVDKVIPETCWEQKRQDVIDNKVDIFVMGEDWKGKFDFFWNCVRLSISRVQAVSHQQI